MDSWRNVNIDLEYRQILLFHPLPTHSSQTLTYKRREQIGSPAYIECPSPTFYIFSLSQNLIHLFDRLSSTRISLHISYLPAICPQRLFDAVFHTTFKRDSSQIIISLLASPLPFEFTYVFYYDSYLVLPCGYHSFFLLLLVIRVIEKGESTCSSIYKDSEHLCLHAAQFGILFQENRTIYEK